MTRSSRVALALLAAAAFAARLARLAESAEPSGTDGYYYVVQVERLLATGRLHAPDGSWVLPFLAAVAAPFRDPILGVKVGAALLASLCVPAAAFAGARIARHLRPSAPGASAAAALALGAWAAVSPTLMQLAAEFPKALGVVAPALVAVGLAAGRPRGRALWLLAAALLAAATAHRLGAALAALGLAGAAAGALARGRGAGAREALRLAGFAALAAGAFALATLLLPNLLHPADLERLRGHLRPAPGWPPPVPYLALRRFHPAQIVELGLPWVAALGATVAWIRRADARPDIGLLALPLAACLVPLWRDDVLDLGYRLCLMAPAVAAPLAAAAWPWRPPGAAPHPVRLGAIAAAAVLLAVPAARAGADPASRPPYERFRRLLAALPQPLPELLIAHQGLAFLYDHETGRDAMAWAPEASLERRAVGRIAWGIRPGEWVAYAPAARVVPLDREYSFLREDAWESFVARARAEGDDDLTERLADWRNPSAIRPRSLARNHDAR